MGVTLDLDEARGALAALLKVDLDLMAVQRLQRLQGEMADRDVGAMLLARTSGTLMADPGSL
jgi:hypothetical protein